jgi:molecular chaperone HtpG
MLLQRGYSQMNFNPKIGAFVLETLTTGMYTDPFDSLREYIQNSSDSIFAAERYKIIEKNAGKIHVEIDPERRTLVIRDNGTGISSTEATEKLLNIGMSSKTYGLEAGFRGIGRLAGIAYCKKLVFTTSSVHEDERCVITFDCEGIRKTISPANRQVDELAEVIKQNTTQDIETEQKDKHYFEVKMIGILENTPAFLNIAAIEEYLSQVAPVDYDAQVFKWTTKLLENSAKNGIEIPKVSILLSSPELGDPRQVFKPFRNKYKTKKMDYQIEIKDVGFFTGNGPEGVTFWMWYGKTDLLGMFDDSKVAGLRFRKNNIAIGGPERVDELFPGNQGRLNYWLIGEIHIIDKEMIPNARRDGFESTNAWSLFKGEIEPFIREHCRQCGDASKSANRPTTKVISSAKAAVDTVKSALKIGIATTTEKNDLLNKLDKEEERVQAAFAKRESKEEQQEVQRVLTSIKDVKNNLQAQNGFTIDKIRTDLDRKQRKILISVIEIVDEALRQVDCKQSNNCLAAVKRAILSKYSIQENS